MCLQYKPFENTVGKGEIARHEQFLLFPHSVFYPFRQLFSILIKYEIVICKLFRFKRVGLKFVIRERVKGGPSDLGTKILQKTKKIILILSKPFVFHS